jgi:hypothetical protein
LLHLLGRHDFRKIERIFFGNALIVPLQATAVQIHHPK